MSTSSRKKPLAWMLLSTALGLFAATGSVQADDTEIFLAGADPDENGVVFPNIMFIIDTSGSMGTLVNTQDPYDNSVTYPGTCDPNMIYITTTNNEPNCANSGQRRTQRGNINCLRARNEFADGRLYSDRMLAWRNDIDRWRELPNGLFNRPVDCQRDQNSGTPDGLNWNDGQYMRDGRNGPYSTRERNLPGFSSTYYLWDGNVLNYGQDAPVPKTRIDTVKEVVDNMLVGLEDVNVGLMRFNRQDGGPVLVPIDSIANNRDAMRTAVKNLPDDGWTPLSETFYEFGQYMYGKDVVYGEGYTIDSVAGSRVDNDPNGTRYQSPVELACQKNYVVYLTDGEPTQDTGAETRIETMIGKQCVNGHNDADGKCLDELAEYYLNTPVIQGASTGIKTYTIGFNIDLKLLADTAAAGGGDYYTADDTAQLTSTLTKITVDILKDSTTFTAPAVPVNAFNRTETLSTVYTSLFQPASSIHWPGNLKRYSFADGRFVGQDGLPAVDPDTGFFRDSAWSYWTNSRDGSNIRVGGAAGQLPDYQLRRLFTDIASNDLISVANKIDAGNQLLTAETFGAQSGIFLLDRGESTADLSIDAKLMMTNWMNGLDYKNVDDDTDINGNPLYTDARQEMGDPLHARPVPIVYGGTEANPDIVLYLPTNDGQLHAVDAGTGREIWSYVPSSLLDRMFELFVDEVSVNRRYMLDGQPTVYVINDDGLPGFNRALDGSPITRPVAEQERAILVMGMRRGGSSYFAIDITDKNRPIKLWEINDDVNGEFPGMGQTWSIPQMGMVKVGTNTAPRPVAVFGGGYDLNQDTNVYNADNVGNAIYMVDLLTGRKIWSAGNNGVDHDLVLDMQHSIPAPPLVIDTNRDGLLDRLYVGDMGGRIWRMDFFNGNNPSTFGAGGILATLGAADLNTPGPQDLRRFYNQVDLVEDVAGELRYFAINIGSGYRAHPLDRDIQEEFYSVRDFKPYVALQTGDPAYRTPVTRANLLDITTDENNTVTPSSVGWRLDMRLNDGEKVLGKSLTINGIVYFTTFAPGRSASACNATAGINYLYKVSMAYGRPIRNLDVIADDEPYETEDFATDLKFGGIASEVFLMADTDVVTNPDGTTKEKTVFRTCASLVCGDDEIALPPTRTFWTEEGM